MLFSFLTFQNHLFLVSMITIYCAYPLGIALDTLFINKDQAIVLNYSAASW